MNGRAVNCGVFGAVIRDKEVFGADRCATKARSTVDNVVFFAVVGDKLESRVNCAAAHFRITCDRVVFLKVVRDKEILHKAYAATNQSKAARIAWNIVPGNNNHVARNHGFKRKIQFFSLSEKFEVCENGNLVMIVVLNNSEIVFTTQGNQLTQQGFQRVRNGIKPPRLHSGTAALKSIFLRW